MIARRLYEDPQTVRVGSRYWEWILQYIGQEYVDAMMRGSDLIEEHAGKQSVSRVEELAQIFIHATNVSHARSPTRLFALAGTNLPQMERGFWDMGLRAGGRLARVE
jgi:thiaminase